MRDRKVNGKSVQEIWEKPKYKRMKRIFIGAVIPVPILYIGLILGWFGDFDAAYIWIKIIAGLLATFVFVGYMTCTYLVYKELWRTKLRKPNH